MAAITLLQTAVALAGAPGPDADMSVKSPAISMPTKTTATTMENSRTTTEIAATQDTPRAPTVTVADKPQSEQAGLPPMGFTIDYKLRYAAFSAELTLSLREQLNTQEPGNESDKEAGQNDYLITATTRARGLAKLFMRNELHEQASFRFVDDRLMSKHYALNSGKKSGEDSGEVSFDWEQMTADSMYEGTRKTLSLETDVYDRMTADIVVITDLRNGRQPRKLRIAEKNQLRDYVFIYEGEERIATPAGEFDTVRYLRQRSGSSRSTLVWYARDAGYLPVRMEQRKNGKTAVTSEAQTIK